MSNFVDRLTELLEAIKSEKDALKRFGHVQTMDAYLANNAPAIRDLVRAAEHMEGLGYVDAKGWADMLDALAKLEEA